MTTNNQQLISGIGINDLKRKVSKELYARKALSVWHSILHKCYSDHYKEKPNYYEDCTVCDEWHKFSAFYEWFKENYKHGYVISKNIIVKDNKVFSPDNCCFVPKRLTQLLVGGKILRGGCLMGVGKLKNKYIARLRIQDNKQIVLGIFDTEEEANRVYKIEKEKYVKEVAEIYYSETKISKKVYDALMNYTL